MEVKFSKLLKLILYSYLFLNARDANNTEKEYNVTPLNSNGHRTEETSHIKLTKNGQSLSARFAIKPIN